MDYLVWRREDLGRYLSMYKYVVEGYKEHRTRLFSVLSRKKYKCIKFCINTRNVFTIVLTEQWNWPPREVVKSSLLQIFTTQP